MDRAPGTRVGRVLLLGSLSAPCAAFTEQPRWGKDVLRCGDPSAPSQSKTGSVEDGKGETQADCAHPLTFGECS